MLSQSIVRSTKDLQVLQLQDYKKIINYSINLLLNHQNQMALHQYIQIEEERGRELTNLALALIRTLVRYRTSVKELDADLLMLMLSKDRREYLREKLGEKMYELRKIVYAAQLGDITEFKELEWRLEIETASKTNKNTFIPNIFMSLHTKQRGVEEKMGFNCDFGSAKYLHQSLLQAMKMHNSSKFKTARNSSV